ncbi:MAG: hypothetical protein KatS3mg081_2559 [Gemmatimonadales bacterium]|nr:MAG: hypothetical protein KatS3mg081_2559 [Gemmatimonadales bacterium]
MGTCAGLLLELLLSAHWEDAWQRVPLAVLGLFLIWGACWPAVRRNGMLWVFRACCFLAIASGVAGSALHYRGKVEFARERDPSLSGLALAREAVKGTSPPLLAPGSMITLGLLGLIWAYRHPAGQRERSACQPNRGGET